MASRCLTSGLYTDLLSRINQQFIYILLVVPFSELIWLDKSLHSVSEFRVCVHVELSWHLTSMMANKLDMYGLISYRKVQLLVYWLCWSYPFHHEKFFEHYCPCKGILTFLLRRSKLVLNLSLLFSKVCCSNFLYQAGLPSINVWLITCYANLISTYHPY